MAPLLLLTEIKSKNSSLLSSVLLYSLRFCRYFNETVCRTSEPFFKEKFTSGDLREEFEQEFMIDLFKTIIEAERHAQLHHCYYSPCGEVTEEIMKTTPPPKNQSSNCQLSVFLIVINLVLKYM